MSQVYRIAVGTMLLAPIVAAALFTGFPAAAATADKTPLSDRAVTAQIDRSAKDGCRGERAGSVEHSICLAERRKDAYRAAADARRGRDAELSYR
jgi:hypothetical protein